jgi:hypothetical protein
VREQVAFVESRLVLQMATEHGACREPVEIGARRFAADLLLQGVLGDFCEVDQEASVRADIVLRQHRPVVERDADVAAPICDDRSVCATA